MNAQWFKEHGLSSSYQDFLDLPWGVVEDGSLLMEAEAIARERAERNRGK